VSKLPTRSPTHEDIEIRRLSSMGLELEEIAEGESLDLAQMIELAEDRGRPVSHYVAAVPLATELRIAPTGALTVKACVGTCQRYGALDLIDHLAERWAETKRFTITPVTCLDRCDQAPACEVHGEHGQLVLAPATKSALDEALSSL
jgi:NADH:ubiquinone oxidoreductase subunit E